VETRRGQQSQCQSGRAGEGKAMAGGKSHGAGATKGGWEILGEARKARWKADPQAEEDLGNPEGMAEPMPKNSAESSGALTPHAREEACKNAAARPKSLPAKRRTERRKTKLGEGLEVASMRAGSGWERSVWFKVF
jgi:hypothetical protein